MTNLDSNPQRNPNPKLVMAKAAKTRPGWVYRNGYLVHSSGLHVTTDSDGFFIVWQYPSTRYNEVANVMIVAEEIDEYLRINAEYWRQERMRLEQD